METDDRPFPSRLIETGIDVSAILEEIRQNADAWDADTSRQTNVKVQRETRNIFLRSARKPLPEGVDLNDCHPSRRTKQARYFPATMAWLDSIAPKLNGRLARATIVALKPQGHVYPHIDHGDYYRVRDRYHLVLSSPGGSAMQWDDVEVTYNEGELWWFDNKSRHAAHNNSDVDRIHLIFDITPPTAFSYEDEATPAAEAVSAPATRISAEEVGAAKSRERPRTAEIKQCLMDLCRALEQEGLNKASETARAVVRLGGRSSVECWQPLPENRHLRRDLLERIEQNAGAGFLDFEVLHHRRTVERDAFARQFGNVFRGLKAMEITYRYESELAPPSRSLKENRSFSRQLELFCERRSLSLDAFWREGTVAAHEVASWRLYWAPDVRLRRLYRGGRLVEASEMTPDSLRTMADDLAGWLVRSCAADGTIPYKYWPSRGGEASGDNALRRFMATVWLNRWASRSGDPDARTAADRNLRRNLDAYFVEKNGRGYIVHDDKAKLGAAAFAAMVLRESPRRPELEEVLQKIDAGIDDLWQPDGSFKTFAWPADRNDNQNFYPGEALLYWGYRHRETGDGGLLLRALKSLAWYRDWHLKNRNPAFVPWHTQAAMLFFQATGDTWLRDWVFMMNDWLLSMQQAEVAAPDIHGRFYDPNHPEYGPPHASSTGVYLEGLADAFLLAQASGDSERAGRYAGAIWAGLRNLRQLQFVDADDLAYYRKRDALLGGMRTEVYDNTLRVDNVQHALGATMKLLEQPAFLATART